MEICDDAPNLGSDDASSEAEFCNFMMKEFDEKENLFRDSLQHSGFRWYCKPVLVMARDILEEKFSREEFFARRQLLYVNYL